MSVQETDVNYGLLKFEPERVLYFVGDQEPRKVKRGPAYGILFELSQLPGELVSVKDLRGGAVREGAQGSSRNVDIDSSIRYLKRNFFQAPDIITYKPKGRGYVFDLPRENISFLTESPEPEVIQREYPGDFDQDWKRLIRYFRYRHSGNDGVVEELAAETMLKMVGGMDRYKAHEDIPFTSWMITIAHNIHIDYCRRIYTAPEMYYTSSLNNELDSDQTSEEELESFGSDETLEGIFKDIEIEKLRQAFKSLEDTEKHVIEYRFLSGEIVSHREVASLVGKTEVAVRQAQVRALKKMRAFLEKDS